jgi:hypothetical protein
MFSTCFSLPCTSYGLSRLTVLVSDTTAAIRFNDAAHTAPRQCYHSVRAHAHQSIPCQDQARTHKIGHDMSMLSLVSVRMQAIAAVT